MPNRGLLTITLLAFLAAGCSRATAPEQSAPSAPATAQTTTVHGILQLAGPGQSGIQGRADPWLAADDGAWLDLELAPEFAALADPANAGRGVTLTGELSQRENVAVGGADQALRVTNYQFDAPQ